MVWRGVAHIDTSGVQKRLNSRDVQAPEEAARGVSHPTLQGRQKEKSLQVAPCLVKLMIVESSHNAVGGRTCGRRKSPTAVSRTFGIELNSVLGTCLLKASPTPLSSMIITTHAPVFKMLNFDRATVKGFPLTFKSCLAHSERCHQLTCLTDGGAPCGTAGRWWCCATTIPLPGGDEAPRGTAGGGVAGPQDAALAASPATDPAAAPRPGISL